MSNKNQNTHERRGGLIGCLSRLVGSIPFFKWRTVKKDLVDFMENDPQAMEKLCKVLEGQGMVRSEHRDYILYHDHEKQWKISKSNG